VVAIPWGGRQASNNTRTVWQCCRSPPGWSSLAEAFSVALASHHKHRTNSTDIHRAVVQVQVVPSRNPRSLATQHLRNAFPVQCRMLPTLHCLQLPDRWWFKPAEQGGGCTA
jgi:hypothetical protein